MKNLVSKVLLLSLYWCLVGTTTIAWAAKVDLKRVEPAFWWVGMKNPNLQLIVYGTEISTTDVSLNYAGVTLKKINKVDNVNYLFVDLEIGTDAKPGKFAIEFKQKGKVVASYTYELRERKAGSANRVGFNQSDVMYLIMPDRFANGDTTNDSSPLTLEKANRNSPSGRHGGDLAGIASKLDYLSDLGITALWINPFVENNMPAYSYHGYAITDFYKVDPRHGTNELFVEVVEKAHKKGIKMVMDMVFNHCAVEHWFFKDMPSKDWVHQFATFTRTNYRPEILSDPYGSDYDRNLVSNGWFDSSMPDLNQGNPFLATYLIQNSIWWVEYSGLDGIRMDTYPYPDRDYMAQWTKAVLDEYPNFSIVGEAWVPRETFTAFWDGNAPIAKNLGYDSHLPSVTDFPLHTAISYAFTDQSTWTTGVIRLYQTLAQDFVYDNPSRNLIFMDNHDVDRCFSKLGHDVRNLKLATSFLLTTRGIPQLYYGTEVLNSGWGAYEHGYIRKDFMGGWKNDPRDAFTKAGRTGPENDYFDYLQKLLQWRKTKSVIHNGKLKQFLPIGETYVYFRYNDNETVMVIINNSDNEDYVKLDTKRFEECMKGFTSGYDVITGGTIKNLSLIAVPAKTAMIIELKK